VIEIINADCRKVMQRKDWRKPDLTFADPPFNIGHEYGDYDDNMSEEAYRSLISEILSLLSKKTRVGGVVALHGNDYLAELYLEICRGLKLSRIAWINWHYRFGQNTWSNWIQTRCHLLVYRVGKPGKVTWNPEAVAVPSDRAAVYKDKRVEDYERGGMKVPGTVWGVPSDGLYWGRVQGSNKERIPGRPNQLPEVYLARIIQAYTNEDDLVFDPFCGTGTTAVACSALGRRCITTDVSKGACEMAKDRVKRGAVRIDGAPKLGAPK